MREIQFRVWDVVAKTWNCNVAALKFKYSDSGIATLSMGFGYEVMQYIGIKDIHGIKIYEGDIVKFEDREWEIVWSDSCFMMSWPLGAAMVFVNDTVEVIGDIYSYRER